MESITVVSTSPSENPARHTPVGKPEASSPIPAADLRAALNLVVRDSLLPVSAGLSALYAVFAVSHLVLLPAPIAMPMSLMATATAAGLFLLRLTIDRKPVPARWAHPLGAIIAGLVLANSLLHLYLTAEPQQTTNLLLLIAGVGFLFLSAAWLALIIILTVIGWAGAAWMSGFAPDWQHFGFALFTATVLAILVHTVRVRTMKRLERLRLQDEISKAELKTALASTEEARRAAESSKRDLMQNEARLRLMTNQMPAVLWTTDTALRFTSALGMGLSALSLQPNQVVGMTLYEYFQTTTPEFFPIAAHLRALQGESVTYEVYWQARTFDCQVEALRDTEGKLVGAIGIALDITERKRAEERIKASLKEKEALIKEMSHRVTNNLQVISSLLNLQAGYIADEPARRVFMESQNRLKALALIHEKLYQSEDLTSIDFSGYVRNLVVHLFRAYKINAHAVTLQLNVDAIILDIDRAIPCGLIINELVSNSLKYAFPGGKTGEIRIDMHEDEEKRLTLTVSDNGIGFPTETDFRKTVSLGMQLVSTLTEQLEGTITLERNCGTTFKIVFRQ
jgi:PAS domain S-box-containing protein